MEMVGESDTISPCATLHFALSSPATHDVVLLLEPDPGSIYHTVPSAGRDTVTLVITGVLAGSTRYMIHPKQAIAAENGATLTPEDAVFTVVTHAVEREPNDGPDSVVADRFVSPVFGSVTTASDTDFYYLPGAAPGGLYIRSIDAGRCNFAVIDDENRRRVARTETGVGTGAVDTIQLDNALVPPLRVQVFSFTGTADLRYELGAVSPKR